MALTKKQWDALQMPQVQPDDGVTTHHLRNLLIGGLLKNTDGSISTVSTMQVNGLPEQQSGKPTLIPSIWDGKRLSPEDASRRAYLQQQFGGVQYPTAKTHQALREKDKTIHQNFGQDLDTAFNPKYNKEKEALIQSLKNQQNKGR
jgi:hypothetical protein